jgi:hypothetical protein
VAVNYSSNGIIAIRVIGYGVTTRLLIGYSVLILVSFPGRKLYFTII